MAIEKPGIYDIPAAEYHADPCPGPSLSSTIARKLVELSPAHAYHAHPRLGGAAEEPPKAHMSLGTAAHSVILERNWDGIAFINAKDWRTTAAKVARSEALARGKAPLLEKDRGAIEDMVNAVKDSKAFEGVEEFERTFIWEEEECWFRARLDATSLHAGHDRILDLKTTGVPATPNRWARTVMLDYLVQCGFYRLAWAHFHGGEMPDFWFVVQETGPPYAVSLFEFDDIGQEYADQLAAKAIRRWKECCRTGEWYGYDRVINTVESPYWIREIINRQH